MRDPTPGPDLRHAASTAGFGLVSIGIMGALAHLAGEPLIFPSLGPTAFLLAHAPQARTSSPGNTILGHGIGVICGFAAVLICGLYGAPNAFAAGVTPMRALAAGLAVGSTGGAMVLTDRVHAPAGATTLIVSLGLMATPSALAALMTGVVLLVGLGAAWRRVAG